MAFDQSTRNRLQKFVSSARAILSEEFTRQLQATYGLDPKLGTNAPIKSLTHLDNRQRQTAHLLRETLAHYLATTPGKTEKDRIKQVLDRIVREQAFTVLNRLAALRMAEARGFLLESIAKAHSSKGFQLYRQLSGTAHGETGDAYRNYLFSLFDEFSLDLAVLFDRHSAQGRLFPRESALLELLSEINHADIEHLWAEDETIGWIYQYFNSQEERKKMRAESQAPRNSRELAVRNQFFTPRYVVEFLTDNTLGRIWYEMTQGNTGLVDSCRYLVRRPTEIFLKPGEAAPETEQNDEALSQQELLQQPVYIPHRPLKDPRTIRMLDPACGSMHFGLYAFDLFERIYLEAWQLEQQLGAAAFTREHGLASLQETFASLDAFKLQIPKLIIEHNIHGVDIDPRAVQIAGLSLWQRAQRAWHQQGIKPQQRPTIVKSNIVCAEPMPGEKALLQEFTSKLNPPVLGQLLEVIFDKMQLAGEAGTLLKIEEEIQTAIQEARKQWLKQSGSRGTSDLFQAELDAAIPQTTLGFDLRGINDESFWDDAEQRILQALSDYAEQAEATADQKRLFAEDAAKGFAFIDLCRKRFDAVLMNPPFGEFANSTDALVGKNYKESKADIYAAFVERGHSVSCPHAYIGAITSKTGFYQKQLEKWRVSLLGKKVSLEHFCDLGYGVLDTAMVETAAYICIKAVRRAPSYFYRLIEDDVGYKESSLQFCVDNISNGQFNVQNLFLKNLDSFKKIPGSPISYWVSPKVIRCFSKFTSLGKISSIDMGMSTKNDFRWTRCFWEVPAKSIGDNRRFCAYAKGTTSSALTFSLRSLVDHENEFAGLKAELCQKYPYLNGDTDWVLHPEYNYKKQGLSFGRRTRRFRPMIMKEGAYFSDSNPLIYIEEYHIELKAIAAFLSSRIIQSILGLITPARKLDVSYIAKLPIPELSSSQVSELIEIYDEFDKFGVYQESHIKSSLYYDSKRDFRNIDVASLDSRLDDIATKALGLDDTDKATLLSEFSNSTGLDFDLQVSKPSETNLLLFKAFLKENPDDIQNLSNYNLYMSRRFSVENLKSRVLTEDDLREISKELKDSEFVESKSLFEEHLKEFTDSPRTAPIFWPLQSSDGVFTIWMAYHGINEQSLYICVNDVIEPKLRQVEQDLSSLRGKSVRSNSEEKDLEKLSDLVNELRDFRDELLRIAKFWKPNLNDGVQITAAPLWKLFQHKAWQKKLKETWDSLEQGEYDWAHLACSIWPDRVLRKCHQDRSLAIAHDVEDHFWHEVEVPVTRSKKATGETKYEWQPKDLTEPEILNLIKRIKEEKGL